ncbi:hypothetical protein N9Y42_00015 [Mariniblastus sp.]|nr:hypothetical protein [Mariniblastus sp.]
MRISIRTLVIGVLLLCVLLGASIQFGSHLRWKITRSEIANGFEAIPTQPLVDVRPNEKLVTCSIGPLTFELPARLTETYEVPRGIGGKFLNFYDTTGRQVIVEIPTTQSAQVVIGDIGNPEFAQQSFPRFCKEVVEAQSSDFSWLMTKTQLRNHIFLLEHRAATSDDIVLLEYLWRDDLEATLTHSNFFTFQWTALDDRLSGTVHFTASSPGETDWIRHFCTSFRVDGDPLQISTLKDSEFKSMLTVTEDLGPQNAE